MLLESFEELNQSHETYSGVRLMSLASNHAWDLVEGVQESNQEMNGFPDLMEFIIYKNIVEKLILVHHKIMLINNGINPEKIKVLPPALYKDIKNYNIDWNNKKIFNGKIDWNLVYNKQPFYQLYTMWTNNWPIELIEKKYHKLNKLYKKMQTILELGTLESGDESRRIPT